MNTIPRYIYHLTTKLNYTEMLNKGFVRVSSKDPYTDGIFCIELTNFFKRWGENSSWSYQTNNLQYELLKKISLKSDIVILRIPTKKLNKDKLKIRSQNIFFNWLQNAFHRKYFLPDERMSAYNFIKDNSSEQIANIVTAKISATDKACHYKRHKHAIEYIYQDNIPITLIEQIGEINIRDFKNSEQYNPSTPVKSIFLELLKGTSERKGAQFLKY